MERMKTKESKKKPRHHSAEEAIEESIPEAPVLSDFLSEVPDIVSSFVCSEGSRNIEREILDAVRDDGDGHTAVRSQADGADNAEQLDKLTLTEVKVELPPSDMTGPKELQNASHWSGTAGSTLGTELHEIHSYNLTADVDSDIVEADTKLASPRRSTVVEGAPSESKRPTVLQYESPKIVKKSEPAEDEMRPFTEVQLLSLYTNRELDSNAEFMSEFVEQHLHSGHERHHLYELLMSYLRARNRLSVNAIDLETLKKECQEYQSQLWTIETTIVSESGECQDGNPVSASHEYCISQFNKAALLTLARSLASVKDLVNDVHSLSSYSSEVLRLQVEHFIQVVTASCPGISQLPPNAPSVLQCGREDLDDLRTCIAVVFSFQRRMIRDPQFISDTREWLSRLVAVLLRLSSWRDHLFLLNHILRCPAGVGSWGASFIQGPPPPYSTSPFSSPHLHHLVAMLATILLPVREREHFLEQVHSSPQDAETDGVWVLVDSDGEEDEDLTGCRYVGRATQLRENDLVALLNQVPMYNLFQHILLVRRQDERDVFDIRNVNEHHVLRFFAFASVLVRLLRQGLRTYDSPRYKQFAKRLGRLIRHTVQYASDLWECFRSSGQAVDPAMMKRLQVEYDAFFLRATRCIFSSQRLGAWQFLAVIPYNTVSISTLWKLFYSLHEDYQEEDALAGWNSTFITDWQKELHSPQLRQQFEEKLTSMPDAESFYLLTTFANMAMARNDPDDRNFVCAATLDLFQVGFLSTATQDSCSKSARVLLANITSRHPSLLSDILHKLYDNFTQAGKLSLYLFKELPLHLWLPTEEDMQIISHWLLDCPLASTENHLARQIITHLNWGLEEHNTGLCLPLELHRQVAVLVVDAALRFTPETLSATGITESVKQVSNLATSMVRPQSNEQVFNQWAWDTITQLRLHILDQPEHVIWTMMANPSAALGSIPDLDISSDFEAVERGVKDRQPLACYVAVLATVWGHSIPLICTKGFNQLQILLCHNKYDAILNALQHLVPLFLSCEESLIKCERFVSILISLVVADRTYMKMARNLISPEFPGPVLKKFSSMIETHLVNYRRYSLVSPKLFVQLWLQSLCQIPDWTKEQGVTYLMDIVLRTAFFHPDARDAAFHCLKQQHENLAGQRHGSSISSFINWVATGTTPSCSLLTRASCPEGPWFAYFVLELEQEMLEERTGLWKEVLRELAASAGKANIDHAVKKAAQTLKIPVMPASNLSIYRWSQQALDTPLDHPLLPLLWQKFFSRFLARVPSVSGVPDRGGVGDKFFEGMINLSFHKKLKKRLQDATEFYRSKNVEEVAEDVLDHAQEPQNELFNADERRNWYNECSKLLRTFSLWLEEPRLHEPNLFLPALPPQYNSSKLAALIQGNTSLWLEYLDFVKVQESQQAAVQEWEVSHFRITDSPTKTAVMPSPEEAKNPVERILKRLQSYDAPVLPPPLQPAKPVLPLVSTDMISNRGALLDGLKNSFKTLLEYAQIYSLRTSEHTALDCNFLELVPLLYRDVELEVVLHAACDSEPHTRRGNITNCAGPAAIHLKVCEARVNEGTEHLIRQNRADYESLLQRAMYPPPQKVCASSVHIEHAIAMLEREYERSRAMRDVERAMKLQDVGLTLFYHIITLYNDEAIFYPPSKQLLSTCIENLGQVFVAGDESQCMRLLGTILQQPQIAGVLGPHFTPAAASTPTFLQMYKTIAETVYQHPSELSFVLLSKFDVARWLKVLRPRLSERSQFIELVGKALMTAGLTPEDDTLILHDTFRKHLMQVLIHDFPEHYGEILNLMLRGSETQSLSLDTWFDLLNTLLSLGGGGKLRAGHNLGKVKEEARNYATEQKVLTHQELRETAVLLGSHFMKERLQYGLYGLYPKYRVYVEPLTAFLGIVSHALVVSTLQHDLGTLSDKLCEQLWPALNEMFSPWLAPYWTKNLKEPTAAWIQQLTDDRSVLLPWIAPDGPHANRVMAMFSECIRFILDTLPACSNILCFVWQFYVASYSHMAVKDHILGVVHTSLLTLPWERFWPSLQDLELMLKVVDQYLPDCHVFLGSVFIGVCWQNWMNNVLTAYPPHIASRAHVCLLHLLIKLANEPNVRQSPKILPLLQESRKFAWHLVDATAYEQVVNWFVMSCDPRVILGPEEDSTDGINLIDCAVVELLQEAAAYVPTATNFHMSTPRKRQIFVRACVKLITSCASRYKNLLTKREEAFNAAIHKMLDDTESVVLASVPAPQQVPEAGLLLIELLVAINQPAGSPIIPLVIESCCSWLALQDSNSVVLQGVFRVIGTTVNMSDAIGAILESALEAFFKHTVAPSLPPQWHTVTATLQPCIPRQPPLEDTLVSCGHLLSLYAMLLKRLPTCRDIREEASVLNTLVEWLATIKFSEQLEPKLPLLWSKVLSLSLRQCHYAGDQDVAIKCLRKLAQMLMVLAEDRGSWNILGAIGLRKQTVVSVRCRLLSRAMAVFVLAQLPDGEPQTIRTTPNAPGELLPGSLRGNMADTEPCPSHEAIKGLTNLESLSASKQYQDLRSTIALAVRQITDPTNSLHNASQILGTLAIELYQQQYLQVLKEMPEIPP